MQASWKPGRWSGPLPHPSPPGEELAGISLEDAHTLLSLCEEVLHWLQLWLPYRPGNILENTPKSIPLHHRERCNPPILNYMESPGQTHKIPVTPREHQRSHPIVQRPLSTLLPPEPQFLQLKPQPSSPGTGRPPPTTVLTVSVRDPEPWM